MGIGNLDPRGKKTKQNVTKLVTNWKRAHQLALSTGFGSTIKNGQLIPAKQQLNDICDVYNELYETRLDAELVQSLAVLKIMKL